LYLLGMNFLLDIIARIWHKTIYKSGCA